MSLLSQVAAQAAGTDIQGERDSLGGGVLPSDVYKAKIKLAYEVQAASGAIGVAFEFELEDSRSFKTTEYITSATKKGGLPYYERNGKKTFLPGYIAADAIANLTTGTPITGDLGQERKLIKLYDFESKKEVPTEVTVLTSLIGKELHLGILKQISNKNVKVGDDYKPTNEKREENVLDKVFSDTGFTKTELDAQAGKPEFIAQWRERNQNKDRNRFKEVKDPAVASAAGTTTAPTQSLFSGS